MHKPKNEIAPSLFNGSKKQVIEGSNVINISQGPQFKTTGGILFAFIFLAFFLISLAALINGEFLLSLLFVGIGAILFSLILDIHGIEVDTRNHKIRAYKALLWFRIGEWSDIKDFKSIYLTKKNVVIRTSEYSSHSSETYHYYHIKLVDELNKKEIFLAEYKNYYKARQISMNITDAVGLEFKDFVKGVPKENRRAGTTKIP